MSNISGISISTILGLGAVLLMFGTGLSSASNCTGEQYTLPLSENRVMCPLCRRCPAGEEPKIPCGSVVGNNDVLRECKPCENGYSSAENDFLPCQPCHSSKCIEHEIVVGTCNKENDTSHCTGNCKKGYTKNSNGSACVASAKEQELHQSVPKGSGLSVEGIVGIIVGVSLLALSIIIGLVWYFKCRSNTTACDFAAIPHKDIENSSPSTSENSSPSTSVELLEPAIEPAKEPETVISQESEDSSKVIKEKPHCNESTNGYVNSQTENETNQVNQTACGKPPVNGSVPVRDAPDNPDVTRFGDLPSSVYQKICKKFNAGSHDKNWEALAGWLGFSVNQVDGFRLENNKADAVIRSWRTIKENTITEFIKILRKNKMTQLVDEINTALSACRV